MLLFLQKLTLKLGVADDWRWKGACGNKLSVKGVYYKIEKRRTDDASAHHHGTKMDGVWRAMTPFKAQIMAWRLLLDRLPTGDNLVKKNLLNPPAAICSCCNATAETAKYLFINCSETKSIWNHMIDWVGMCWSPPQDTGTHREAFSNLLGKGKLKRKLDGLWICIVWVIWKWHNAKLFEGLEWDNRRIENEIKCRFWSWCAAKGEAEPCTSFIDWASKKLYETWVVI